MRPHHYPNDDNLRLKLLQLENRFLRTPATLRTASVSRIFGPSERASVATHKFVIEVVLPQLSASEIAILSNSRPNYLNYAFFAEELHAVCSKLVVKQLEPVVHEVAHEVAPSHVSSSGNTISAYSGTPITRGLIIRSEPLDRILSGAKTWEMRSKNLRKLGLVALIRKSSCKIFGVARIAASHGPLSKQELLASISKHGITPGRLNEPEVAKCIFAWELSEVRALYTPIPYIHKGGVTFATLDLAATAALASARFK